MNNANLTLSIATLFFTLAPLHTTQSSSAETTNPSSAAAQTAKQLEAKVRQTAGDAVEASAKEVADRLRGQLDGALGAQDGTDDGEAGEDEFGTEAAPEALLERLASIDERLCAIEGMLATLTAGPASALAGAPAVPPATAPSPMPGATVTAGFEKARVRVWHHGKDATVKLSVNGIPAGRFDTDTTFDLAPFLQSGRMNQLAFSIDPRGKGDVGGLDLYVEAQMPGAHDYVAILQFKSTKERLADTFELPWAPR